MQSNPFEFCRFCYLRATRRRTGELFLVREVLSNTLTSIPAVRGGFGVSQEYR